MTENEIVRIEDKSLDNAISAYKTTIKVFEKSKDSDYCTTLDKVTVALLEELKQYRAIGTIEEFKALKEKSVAKKPRFYAHNYYCIECGNLVGSNEFEWQRFLYCDKCGQKLDWQ